LGPLPPWLGDLAARLLQKGYCSVFPKMEEIDDGMPDYQQVLELGIMLEHRRAFGLVAGRCSAAQAECLGKVRDEKTYLKFDTNWAESCGRQLKIAKRTADARSRC
jgi:hypothetical protein